MRADEAAGWIVIVALAVLALVVIAAMTYVGGQVAGSPAL